MSIAGRVKLRVRPTGTKKRKLNRTHRVNLRATVTYTPTGGAANSRGTTIRLVRKRGA